MTLDARAEAARGYLLLFVFYVHGLIAFALSRTDPAAALPAAVQIKLLAPQVGVFFLLSGMGSRALARRAPDTVAAQSVAMILLALASHVLAFLVAAPFYNSHETPVAFIKALIKPMVYGRDLASFVGWFFIVIAVARPFAYVFERSRLAFVVAAVVTALAIWATRLVGLPNNLWDWRSWPAAVLLFLLGMRIARDWRPGAVTGLGALGIAILLTWINRPGLLADPLCFDCGLDFVAEPLIGRHGTAPVYLVALLAFATFILWVAQLLPNHWITRTARFVGRNSVEFLVLHGVLMALLFPLFERVFPERASPLFFVILFVGIAALHLAAFRVVRMPLRRLVAACFWAGASLTARVMRVPHPSRRGVRPAG